MISSVWERGGCALLLFAAGSAVPAVAEDAPLFELSNGRSVALTPVESMSCEALSAKLDEIDATGYRGARPEPPSRADRRMLDYETVVSMRYYTTCVDMSDRPIAPSNVFRGGFRALDDDAAD